MVKGGSTKGPRVNGGDEVIDVGLMEVGQEISKGRGPGQKLGLFCRYRWLLHLLHALMEGAPSDEKKTFSLQIREGRNISRQVVVTA